MNISIISFTQRGMLLSRRVAECFPTEKTTLYTMCSQKLQTEDADGFFKVTETLNAWTGTQMREKNTLIFIGACGIAVRAIAPFVQDKRSDPPVLLLDERGKFVIPLLSGHLGGANELADRLAEALLATAVITTATDLEELPAIDLFAKKNDLVIVNKEGIARVSARLLAGERIAISVAKEHLGSEAKFPEPYFYMPYPPKEPVDVCITKKPMEAAKALLWLRPRTYVIGMGVRRGKEQKKVADFIASTLRQAGIAEECVAALASVEQKRDEECFLCFSRERGIPFLTFSPKQLATVEGEIHGSEFVEKTIGVDNVCERAALFCAGRDARLVWKKHACDGMTIAIAERIWRVSF